MTKRMVIVSALLLAAALPVASHADLDWIEANNNIYWGNGVADWIYYNGLVYANDYNGGLDILEYNG